jgi:hypothetical protein
MKPKIDSPIKLYFYKYLKGGQKTFNVGGLLMTPHFNEEMEKVEWYFENPNKVSINLYALNGYIDNLLFDFTKTTSPKFYDLLRNKQYVMTNKELYFSPKDKKEFLEKLSEVKTFSFDDFSFDVEPFDLLVTTSNDRLLFTVFLTISNPHNPYTDEKLSRSELYDMMGGLDSEDDFIGSFDNHYASFINYIFHEKPNIFDHNDMYIQLDLRFFLDNKEIKYWY